jgi:hypothetical protein
MLSRMIENGEWLQGNIDDTFASRANGTLDDG